MGVGRDADGTNVSAMTDSGLDSGCGEREDFTTRELDTGSAGYENRGRFVKIVGFCWVQAAAVQALLFFH